eukprot:scpid104017/ scgid10499/ 
MCTCKAQEDGFKRAGTWLLSSLPGLATHHYICLWSHRHTPVTLIIKSIQSTCLVLCIKLVFVWLISAVVDNYQYQVGRNGMQFPAWKMATLADSCSLCML